MAQFFDRRQHSVMPHADLSWAAHIFVAQTDRVWRHNGRGRAMDDIFVERLWRAVKYEEVYLKHYGAALPSTLTPTCGSSLPTFGTGALPETSASNVFRAWACNRSASAISF